MQFSVTFNATINWLIIKWMKQRVGWSSKRTTWLNKAHTYMGELWLGGYREGSLQHKTRGILGYRGRGRWVWLRGGLRVHRLFLLPRSVLREQWSIHRFISTWHRKFILPPFNSWPPLSIYFRSLKSAKSHLPCSFSASVGELGTIKGVLEKLSGVGAT